MADQQLFYTIPDDPVVQHAVEQMADMSNFQEALQYLSGQADQTGNFERVSSLVYRRGEITFHFALRISMMRHGSSLRLVHSRGFSTAPQLIAFILFPDEKSCLLVTRIAGVDRSLPVPCQGSNWQYVTPEGKAAFLADAEKQMASGFICTAALNTRSWHVIPATGHIILTDWSDLAGVRSEAAAETVLEKLRREFADRGL